MAYFKKSIAILLTIAMGFCSGGAVFAEEPSAESAVDGSALTQQVQPETSDPAQEDLPTVEEDQPEAAEAPDAEEIPELEEVTEEPDQAAADADRAEAAADEIAEEKAGGNAEETVEAEEIEIAEATSPIEASQAAPAADNDAFYTVDLNNGKVTDLQDKTVADGFAEIYGEKYSETGLKTMPESQREDQIAAMTEETDLYALEGTDGETAEVSSIYAACRLIVEGKVSDKHLNTYGAVQGTLYQGSYVLSYENEETTASAYVSLCEEYGEENVFIDLPVKAQSTDRYFSSWNVKSMEFPKIAPQIKSYGDNVTVAVLDSGINRKHEAFQDGRTICKGYDFVNHDSNPADDQAHGTAVASIIAQCTESNVRILPIKVLNSKGSGNMLDLIYGLEYARKQGADAANMSLGLSLIEYYGNATDAKAWIAKTDKYFKKFTGPIIVAAGNDHANIDTSYAWPAVSKYTIAVSALTQGTSTYPGFDLKYSNYGESVDYAAPGTKVNVANYRTTNGYVMYGMDGTSFASPHIAAAAALIMANNCKVKTKSQVKKELNKICHFMDMYGTDGYSGSYYTSDGVRKNLYCGYGMPIMSSLTVDKSVRKISKTSVKIANKTYTGKALKPAPKVKYGRATLVKNKNYTLKYYNNKNVGKAKVIITGKGKRHKGKKTVYFKINPKGTKLKYYKSARKSMTVYWKKQAKKMSKTRITGYQVQVATNNKFTKNRKSKKVKGYKKTKVKFKKLKKNTRYYVRIRTYKKTKTGTYYSPWSKPVYGYTD